MREDADGRLKLLENFSKMIDLTSNSAVKPLITKLQDLNSPDRITCPLKKKRNSYSTTSIGGTLSGPAPFPVLGQNKVIKASLKLANSKHELSLAMKREGGLKKSGKMT